jgi:hypothetical protein
LNSEHSGGRAEGKRRPVVTSQTAVAASPLWRDAITSSLPSGEKFNEPPAPERDGARQVFSFLPAT